MTTPWEGWERARKTIGLAVSTQHDPAALVARVVLGMVMLPHGLQKVTGAFGGAGFDAEMDFFTQVLGIPWTLGLTAVLAESVGALALVVGLAGRVAALGIAVVMAVAARTVHWDHGFFMNWSGSQAVEGVEYHALAVGLAVVVVLRGSGAWSIDQLWARRLEPQRPAHRGGPREVSL